MTNEEAYRKGYKDGQEALAFHLELCKEEQEPCEDCISFPKGTLKKRGKGYVVYNPEWLKENWKIELKVMGIECEDYISRQAVLALKTPVNTTIGWSGYMIDALDVEQLPSIQPKPKTDVLDKIRAEIHATAEMHEDGDYYLRDEWIDEIIDKYKAESEG